MPKITEQDVWIAYGLWIMFAIFGGHAVAPISMIVIPVLFIMNAGIGAAMLITTVICYTLTNIVTGGA